MATIPNVPNAVTFWHGPKSWLYTCPLGDNIYEITTMVTEPDETQSQVSWGQEATFDQVIRHFQVRLSLLA
jgi:salicylate hydroxylase